MRGGGFAPLGASVFAALAASNKTHLKENPPRFHFAAAKINILINKNK